MTRLTGWLRPPRTLLLALFLLTLVSVSALGWFGWRLLEQETLLEAQRSQERLEQAADRIAAAVRTTLAETGDRMAGWESGARPPVNGSVLLLLKEDLLEVSPGGSLLYYPYPAAGPEANPAIFAEAEMFEFLHNQPSAALVSYQKLAGSTDAAVRAGALLRMARVLRAMGRLQESRLAYQRLAGVPDTRAAGVAAELVARLELARLSGTKPEAEALLGDLQRGGWRLSRGQFEFYWSEASRLAGRKAGPPAEAVMLAETVGKVWSERQRNAEPRGLESLWIAGRPYLLIWRGTPERRAVLLAHPESLLKHAFEGEEVACAVVDSGGRVLAGHRNNTERAAILSAAESQLPWTIYVAASGPASRAGLLLKQRFLLLGTSVMVAFLLLGTYFIARVIRREAEVSRMQSDFVAAVSHEFRSPLTSMRQLSEILAFGRTPSEERRQLYYETLVKETTRLQRVVEALLQFGRMEAGARQYRFEDVDAGHLVRRVVAEFEQQIAGFGGRVEIEEAAGECHIDADPDAICVALRNLLDNAIKYSPDHPVVWVECGAEREHVAIRVRDLGVGIPEPEQKAIFDKFVRGSAARATNAKGSGVGLAMVRHIVAAHGGEVRVSSRLGQGSTFTMLFPAVERT